MCVVKLNWLCSGLVNVFDWVVVLIRVNGVIFSGIDVVLGFLLIIILMWKFFIVRYSIFLVGWVMWWILLINNMLCLIRLDSIVVRLLVCFNVGFDVICSEDFSLVVMIIVNDVLFKFGGLDSRM